MLATCTELAGDLVSDQAAVAKAAQEIRARGLNGLDFPHEPAGHRFDGRGRRPGVEAQWRERIKRLMGAEAAGEIVTIKARAVHVAVKKEEGLDAGRPFLDEDDG